MSIPRTVVKQDVKGEIIDGMWEILRGVAVSPQKKRAITKKVYELFDKLIKK